LDKPDSLYQIDSCKEAPQYGTGMWLLRLVSVVMSIQCVISYLTNGHWSFASAGVLFVSSLLITCVPVRWSERLWAAACILGLFLLLWTAVVESGSDTSWSTLQGYSVAERVFLIRIA
jgi:hypothetical protein